MKAENPNLLDQLGIYSNPQPILALEGDHLLAYLVLSDHQVAFVWDEERGRVVLGVGVYFNSKVYCD